MTSGVIAGRQGFEPLLHSTAMWDLPAVKLPPAGFDQAGEIGVVGSSTGGEVVPKLGHERELVLVGKVDEPGVAFHDHEENLLCPASVASRDTRASQGHFRRHRFENGGSRMGSEPLDSHLPKALKD